jgi:hypothetical protein
MRTDLRRFLLSLALLAACSQAENSDGAAADPPASSDLVATLGEAPMAQLVHRMPPGSTSTLSLRTLPDAVCALSVPGSGADATHVLRVYSDDDGVARVQLDHLDEAVRLGSLQLDCRDDAGRTFTHDVSVVIDDQAVVQAPVRYRTAGKPTLPVLDPGAALTDAELDARHYPPRPDAAASPAQREVWSRLVTSAPTVVAPHLVSTEARTHSTANTSNNWSGYVVTSPSSAPIYAWIYGEWHVPRAYAESGFASWDHSSFWVGIDGWGSNDVVQDGTDQDTLTAFWIQTSSYDAWVEWYPLNSNVISNFPVNPGDLIHAWTWLTDGSGNYTPTPTVGRYYLWNETENVYVYTSIDIPSGAKFSGHQAEWIMERPTVLGSVSSLANYASARLTNALVYDLAGSSHLYGGDSSDVSHQVTMIDKDNGNAVLSTVAPVNGSTMAFTFHAHE